MKRLWTILLVCAMGYQVFGQKVGLVLSGGGAKGIAHIGMIQALEENGIPIDYITGTSMGAIIGALYANGYSPHEMLALIESENFTSWYKGEVEEQYRFYFKKADPTPQIYGITIGLSEDKKIIPHFIPKSLVNPVQMNLAIMGLFGQAGAYCGGDFNKLFVPYRCVASDIWNKTAVVPNNGDFGNAVRASMTFPLVFRPIEMDSVLLFDGGIYNNFPIDVMQKEFHPQIIIGGVVASGPKKPNVENPIGYLETMIMQPTEYAVTPEDGFLIRSRFTEVGLLDFHKAQLIYNVGYDQTISQIDSIKQRISRRVDPDSLQKRRAQFAAELPALEFENIEIEGLSPSETVTIRSQLKDLGDTFSFEEFKYSYFKLLADNKISEILPSSIYNPETERFTLHLKIKKKDPFFAQVGANISSGMANQFYLGLGYKSLSFFPQEYTLDGQIGMTYSGVRVSGRIDLATKMPIYALLEGVFHQFNYNDGQRLFLEGNQGAFIIQNEGYIRARIGMPFLVRGKLETSIGFGSLHNIYYKDKNRINLGETSYSRYNLGALMAKFESNSLNHRYYPTEGMKLRMMAQYIFGNELYAEKDPASQSIVYSTPVFQQWLQFNINYEQYFNLHKHFTLGIQADMVYSSQNFFANYWASAIQAPGFTPTMQSQYTFNQALHANQYVALGIKPIWTISDMFQLRGEFYGFMPFFPIKENDNGEAYYGDPFSVFRSIAELSFVVKLPFATVSLFGSYYSSPNQFYFGLNIGNLIFNRNFIEN